MTIHWFTDALITLGLTGIFVVAFVVISACRLSSMISRDEEDRELRATFDRIKRVA